MATEAEWKLWLDKYSDESQLSFENDRTTEIVKCEVQETTMEKQEATVMEKDRSVAEELQSLCDILLDDATSVTWDLYRENQQDKLELKVRMSLFPESVKVDDQTGQYHILEATDAESKQRNGLIKHVSAKIWQQRKHTKTCLRMSIVYIGLVKHVAGCSPLHSTTYMIRPLFRTMKCIDRSSRSSAHGQCMVFVDEFGWVYRNWEEFMANTLYPDTMIVAPERGIFNRADSGAVKLYYFPAPMTAEEIEKQKWTDIGLTITGVSSAVVLASAAIFPVTAPIVWSAAAIGVAVGAFTGFNSINRLVKRSHHEQDIGLGDRESRAHWLAICGTVLGFAASGATTIVRGAATAGNVSKTLIVASNTVCGASMVVNGVAVGNNIFSVAINDRPITRAELLQLSVSLFLFTHSVYNYQTAQQVVKETQAQHLADYKQTLSKNGQRNFQKKINARAREAGAPEVAMGDTIRNLNAADHYNANFKGTDAYKATTATIENPKVKESLLPSFVKYVPHCLSALLSLYTVIVTNEGEDNWELLKRMAERILDRYISSGLKVEWVIRDCYRMVNQEAKQKRKTVSEVLKPFKENEDFSSIPVVVREHYSVFVPVPGPLTCKTCGGARWAE